jgi:hypothetical protein
MFPRSPSTPNQRPDPAHPARAARVASAALELRTAGISPARVLGATATGAPAQDGEYAEMLRTLSGSAAEGAIVKVRAG